MLLLGCSLIRCNVLGDEGIKKGGRVLLRKHSSILFILLIFQILLFTSKNCFPLYQKPQRYICGNEGTGSCSVLVSGLAICALYTWRLKGLACKMGSAYWKFPLKITNNIAGLLRAYCGPYSQMIVRFLLNYRKSFWVIRIWVFSICLP